MYGPPTPLNVRWTAGHPVIEWCDFRDLAFTDPFFIHTYFRLRERHPDTRTWETGADHLLQRADEVGVLEPSGFIFHMSRCGSTLLSRLLGSSTRVLSLGEPDPLLGMLDFPASVGLQERRTWLRALILALGRPRRASECHYVIKFTSYCLFHMALIHEVFPGTPWVFVFREPVAVMQSVLCRPNGFMRMQARPEEAARYLELPPTAISAMAQEEYAARFLARMCAFALAQESSSAGSNVRFIPYEWLPEAAWDDVAPLFGIPLSPQDKARMDALRPFYSKDPTFTRRFRPVPGHHDLPASDQARAAVRRWLSEPYSRIRTRAFELRRR
jgi:hypothetical protein